MNRSFLVLAAFLVLAIGIFSAGAKNDYVLDSEIVVRDNPAIATGTLKDAVSADWWNVPDQGIEKTLYRPVPQFLFAVLHRLGDGPTIYNHANVLFHALTAFMRFLLLAELFRRFAHGRIFAFIGAALALCHGAAAEAVVGIVGAAEILASFFAALSLWALVRAVRSEGAAQIRMLVTAGIGYALAIFSKESAVLLPIAYLPIFLMRDPEQPNGKVAPVALGAVVFSVAAAALWWTVRAHVLGHALQFGKSAVYGEGEFTAVERITSSLAAMGRAYLPAVLWPFGLTPNITHQDIRPPAGFGDLRVIGGIIAWAALAVWYVVGLVRRSPAAVLAGVALAFLIPTSNLIVPIGAIAAYRFLYAPIFALTACLAYCAAGMFAAARRERFVLLGAMGYLAVVGIAGAVGMVAQWKDGKTLYAKALEINPKSTWALQNDTYVSYLQNDGLSHDQRLAALRRIDKVLPSLAVIPSTGKVDRQSAMSAFQMLSNLGMFICEVARDPAMATRADELMGEAQNALVRAEKYSAGLTDNLIDLRVSEAQAALSYFALIINDKNRPAADRAAPVDDAARMLQSVDGLLPQSTRPGVKVRALMMRFQLIQARRAAAKLLNVDPPSEGEAEAALREALKIDPLSLEATTAYADFLAMKGDYEGALAQVQRLIAAKRVTITTLMRTATYLEALKKPEEARRYYEQVMRMRPHSMEEANMQKMLAERLQKGRR